MKKIIVAIAFVFISFISFISFSQNPSSRGSNQLNLGVGFSGWGIPLYVGFDHFINRDITLGAELSYRSYREDWNHNIYNQGITGISGNLNYHFNRVLSIPSRWDLYAGVNLGFFVWSSPTAYDGNNHSGLGFAGQIGTRYNLTNRVGLNLEFGGGNAFAGGKFGLTIKI
jgi:outer membrane immunogenic protein